jgi:RNase P subunit RPR2
MGKRKFYEVVISCDQCGRVHWYAFKIDLPVKKVDTTCSCGNEIKFESKTDRNG